MTVRFFSKNINLIYLIEFNRLQENEVTHVLFGITTLSTNHIIYSILRRSIKHLIINEII